MAHQIHIKSEKYRQWVKAGLGLGYLKEGLAPFCDAVAKQQHNDILDNIKRIKNIPTVLCGTCTLKTLQPDHVKLGNKQCPLRHTNCNCCYTSGKTPCPNNVCGAIYDSIITFHASTPPVPYWKNTQTQQWTADPWSIAKCFINAPGYDQKTSAADTDCTGLLHVIINNKYFHNHVSCNTSMPGPNIFSKVRQYRNEIFHSSTMELDSTKTNSYIDDMIAVLQDGKELIHRKDAKEAVKKLQDLKNEAFIITTDDVEKVLGDIKEDLRVITGTTAGLEKDNEDQKRKLTSLESKTSELEEEIIYIRDISSKKRDYDSSKADLREKLIKEYRENLLHVSAMPSHQEHACDFRDVYVRPRIIVKSKNENGHEIETEVEIISDIFKKEGKPLKSIYILGEAGSGKSSFCKSLVHNWCIAHSTAAEHGGKRQKIKMIESEDYIDEINEMKNFNFLFLISLRHCTEQISINDMLESEYGHPVLKDLIECESEACLIVLDGLDEWTSTSQFPPKRAKFSNYTVLTTSRPWKIGSLGISDNEMRQSVHINGFDYGSKWRMITKMVNILNEAFKENKDPDICEKELENESFDSLTHTAMMFQQLICLWFDDRLHETSKCNLYTSMLDLFFVWYKKKVQDAPLFTGMLNKSHDIELPGYLNTMDECKSHSYIIQGVSRLAYETLIKNAKETSLTFDSSMFQMLGISDDIKPLCLKLGILSEVKGPSLSASSSRRSHISFIHKSIQEYLAAVFIIMNINTKHELSLDTESAALSDYFSNMFDVKNVDDVLEQENVLIMMCGLEPRVAESICKFIYNTVERDERVVKYRKTTDSPLNRNNSLIRNIQILILSCVKETKASNRLHQFSFDLGDLVFEDISLFEGGNEQNITFDRVISFNINLDVMNTNKCDGRILDYMTNCKNLEAIKTDCKCDKEMLQCICDSIEAYASTLKCWYLSCSLYGTGTPVRRLPFRHIAYMTHLVALHVWGFTVTHDDFTSLCTFLSGTGHLQQISIGIRCECQRLHEVDLSNHKQLQYLQYTFEVKVTNADCPNLEFFKGALFDDKLLDILCNSKKLNGIFLSFEERSSLNEHVTVSNKLYYLLSLLHQLRKLTLYNVILTDNVIICPSEMKSLESIGLTFVTMSLTTWRKFVDSVAKIPQPVNVEAHGICITRDGQECNPNRTRGERGGEEAAAIQYARGELDALFDFMNYGMFKYECN